jgi:hypothetical protein
LNRLGRRENGSSPPDDRHQLFECPTQAKSGLEWATSPNLLASKGLSRRQKQIE